MLDSVFEKLINNKELDKEDVRKMLEIQIFSSDYYKILQCANSYAHKTFDDKGIVFAQIGIDAAPCSVNCRFCQLGNDNYKQEKNHLMSCEDIVNKVTKLIDEGANEIFLMCTADYDKEAFLKIGQAVRMIMPKEMKLVANTADFDSSYAKEMLEVGFTGAYHICRLGEGVDTAATVEERIETLNAIKNVGLELYYCVEPIGPEHTNEQIAEEIYRAKEYHVNVMAVMRRINFEQSPMLTYGEITAAKLALICAVSVLYVRPNRAMGVHEPEIISLIAGANQIYAENGSNPRDTSQQTEKNRGFSVYKARKMLMDAQWNL